ncbi:MAG: PAS domain S-box protein [Planctomycetota bacterium]
MNSTDKISEQLISEISQLRKQIADLEKAEQERNRMVETLRKERDFSSAIVETVGALVVVLDRQGRIVSFNKTCEEVTGYTSKEVFTKNVWDVFIIPEEVKQVKDVFGNLVGTKLPSKFENYWVTKDGRRRLIAWSNSVLLDDNNSVEFIIGTGIDITERREAIKSLKESEEKYRTMIENSLDMIWTFDAQGTFTFVNQQITSLLGYKIEDIRGKPFGPYIYPDDIKIANEAFQNTMGGKPQQKIMRIYKSDRTLFTMLFTLAPVYKEGKVVGGVGFGVDIGTRKLMEDALHESEKRYRTLAESAHDMIFIVGPDFHIQYVNPFGAKQFNTEPSKVIGKHLKEFFPHDIQRMQANLQKVYDTAQPLYVSNKTLYPKGMLEIETWLTPIMDSANNKVASVMGIARDISDWKKKQDEIIQTKQTLETVTGGISDSIFLISRDYAILWANAAAEKETGRPLKELEGKHCYEVSHNRQTPCDETEGVCPITEVLITGQPLTVAHTHIDKQGKNKTIEVSAYPIKDRNGEIIQFVHIGREKGARKQKK